MATALTVQQLADRARELVAAMSDLEQLDQELVNAKRRLQTKRDDLQQLVARLRREISTGAAVATQLELPTTQEALDHAADQADTDDQQDEPTEETTTFECKACGETLADGVLRCAYCGADVLKCTSCGAIVAEADTSCPACGESFEDEEPPTKD